MSEVDDYLKNLSKTDLIELNRIRNIVKELVPNAVEIVSYGIPGFKYKNKYLVGYGKFKNHLSLFPTSHPINLLKDKLAVYKVSKGTIQFTSENNIQKTLIKDLVTIRINDIDKS